MSGLTTWASAQLPTFARLLGPRRPSPAAESPLPPVHQSELLGDLDGEVYARVGVPTTGPVVTLPVVLDLPRARNLSAAGALEVPVRLPLTPGEARDLAAQLLAAAEVAEASRPPRQARPGTLCACTAGGRDPAQRACPDCRGTGEVSR